MMKCTRCGTVNRAQVQFCRHCGQPLLPEQTLTVQTAQNTVNSPTSKIICSNCGTALNPTALFCPRCGLKQNRNEEHAESQQSIYKPAAVPTYQPPVQQPRYAKPAEFPLPSSKTLSKKQKTQVSGKYIKDRPQKAGAGKILGAVLGIIILIVILVTLMTIFIPRTLKGTGLLTSRTATSETVAQASPTLTVTPSLSPTTEPSPTQQQTRESQDAIAIPSASIFMSATPQTLTVGSQVTLTVSITNETEGQITPIRSDLIGKFAPAFILAEGVDYSLTPSEAEPPLSPDVSQAFIYSMYATNAGIVTIQAVVIIEVNSPDHRQVILSNPVILNIK